MLIRAGDHFLLKLFIQPNAKKSEIIGPYQDLLKMKIKSPPVDGKANAELLRFLGELLGVRASTLELAKGSTSRRKTVIVTGLSEATIRNALGMQLPKTD